MKRLLMLVATAFTLFGCSDDSDDNSNYKGNNDEIQILAYLADIKQVNSRTSISGSTGTASWIAGDEIGIFSPQARLSATNVNFAASGTGSLTWSTSTPIYWADGTTVHTFLAYAPYASGNTSASAVKLPQLTPQTGTINPAQDFLISNSLGTTGITRASNNGTVGLTFTHAFALINLQITIQSSLASGTTLQSCSLSCGTSDKPFTSDNSSTIALSTAAITTGTTASSITVTPITPPTLSSTVTNLFIVVLPGSLTPTFQFVIAEGGTNITIPTAALTATNYAAGNKYTYAVSISRTAISISTPTITDWAAGGSGNISGGI